jgi:hypothetical protein
MISFHVRVVISGMYLYEMASFCVELQGIKLPYSLVLKRTTIVAPPRCSSKYSQLCVLHHYLKLVNPKRPQF